MGEHELYCVADTGALDGFTDGATLRAMDSRDIAYLGRLESNAVMQTKAEPYLVRSPGRPPATPHEWCHDLEYQAES